MNDASEAGMLKSGGSMFSQNLLRKAAVPLMLLALGCATNYSARSRSQLLGETPGVFIALSVADMDKVLPWYRDTLGFSVFSEGVAPGRPIRFALLQQGTALVELLQLPDAKPRVEAAPATTDAHQIHGFFKSGFVVDDIDDVYQRLKAKNVTFAYGLGKPPNGPYRSFGVRDPEGNLLQFFGR